MNPEDESWVADLRQGREDAVLSLRRALVRNLRRALADRGALDASFVEDIAQDALVRVLDRLDQFAGRSRLTTWATSIAIRLALSELRRKRWNDVSLDAVVADGAAPPPLTAADAARSDRQALLAQLHDAIEHTLTERQRFVLVAELKGAPQEEIAKSLGSNRNAVYKLAHDARKKLRTTLEAAGYSAADLLSPADR